MLTIIQISFICVTLVRNSFNTYNAEVNVLNVFNKEKKPKYCHFKILITEAYNNLADSADQGQTARSVQSDLDLHGPQKQPNLAPAL